MSKDKEFGSKLLVDHLADILAGLLQICNAPLKKPVTESELHLWNRLQEERKRFQEILNQLLTVAYPPLLVQSLLLLQGPKASHAKIIRVNISSYFKFDDHDHDSYLLFRMPRLQHHFG